MLRNPIIKIEEGWNSDVMVEKGSRSQDQREMDMTLYMQEGALF